MKQNDNSYQFQNLIHKINKIQEYFIDLKDMRQQEQKSIKSFEEVMQILNLLKQRYELLKIYYSTTCFDMLEKINRILQSILQHILNFFQENNIKQLKLKKVINQNIFNISKLESIAKNIPNILKIGIDDLMVGNNRKYLKKYIEVIKLKDLKTLKNDWKKQQQNYCCVIASIRKCSFNEPVGSMNLILKYPYYFLRKDLALKRAKKLLAYPNLSRVKQIWQLSASTLGQFFINFSLKNIKYNKEFAIHYITKPWTIQQLMNNNLKLEHIEKYNLQPKVNIRIVCYQNLENNKINGCCSQSIKMPDTIILHVHGGGWVSSSSNIYQKISRQIAYECRAIVVNVDYTKCPEGKFPLPLNQCFQTYIWITKNLYKYFKIEKPHRLIFLGDSAGGNMILGLTLLILKLELTLPDGIVLLYPSVNISNDYFSPSYIQSFDDFLLHHSILSICRQEYLGNVSENQQHHPLISPIFASEQWIKGDKENKKWPKNWPVTRIISGSLDPLHDDSWRLLQRILQSTELVKLIIYQGIPHGIINLWNMKESEDVSNKVTEEIKDLINLSNQI